MVEPVQGGQFHRFPDFPGPPVVNQFSLVKAVDGSGPCVVSAVSSAVPRGLYARLVQVFGVA